MAPVFGQRRSSGASLKSGACDPCAANGEHADDPPAVKISVQTDADAKGERPAEPDMEIGPEKTPVPAAPNGEQVLSVEPAKVSTPEAARAND
jgi:hypothetical protein